MFIFHLAVEPWERSKLCNLAAEIIRPTTRCFSFSWNPAFSSACSSFYGIHLPFCFLAEGLEASQIYNTEKEYKYIEAPSDNKHVLWWALQTCLFRYTSESNKTIFPWCSIRWLSSVFLCLNCPNLVWKNCSLIFVKGLLVVSFL